MAERRALLDGLKHTPPAEVAKEKAFVFGEKPAVSSAATIPVNTPQQVARSPLSTKIRSDYAAALKKASLQRQIDGIEPHTLQDILEAAIEPWLKSNGYL